MFSVEELENIDKPKKSLGVSRDPVIVILTAILPAFSLGKLAFENCFYKIGDHCSDTFLLPFPPI